MDLEVAGQTASSWSKIGDALKFAKKKGIKAANWLSRMLARRGFSIFVKVVAFIFWTFTVYRLAFDKGYQGGEASWCLKHWS